ncbi:histone deacetylase complex subunit SAP30L isoform X3 [Narcine bancroftii]|uniref:histone deacetylase complex subunit SAP30L isoform X3 n=1 Tax=Narcine bancroftii TaxID=1343680 RepID=UPI00383165B0
MCPISRKFTPLTPNYLLMSLLVLLVHLPLVRHLYICDFHKSFIQSVRNKRKRKGSDDEGGDSPDHEAESPEVDLFQLQVNTLRRYKRHFKLQTRPGLNKAQLAEVSDTITIMNTDVKVLQYPWTASRNWRQSVVTLGPFQSTRRKL